MIAGGESPELVAGSVVDHYKVIRLVGRGWNGEVYLARDSNLLRKVALKVIRPDALGSKEAVERFLFEARATARLSHPHIVTVFGVGDSGGRPYVALEYLEGRTLRQRMFDDPPGAKESFRIGLAIADALKEAHARKILHRDLKPENVILPKDGRLRVVDFGLAKVIGREIDAGRILDGPNPGAVEQLSSELVASSMLHSQLAGGTPAYMAPEQWTGGDCTEATDVWALGVIMYELIAGRRPFSATSLPGLGARIAGSDPVEPLSPSAEVPPAVVELIHRGLEKQPRLRPTAGTFGEVLAESLASTHPSRSGTRPEESAPFRGLSPFSERDADLFFGREAEVATFLERMREQPVLPVVGPSGAGKSSFVRAGIIPRLWEQGRWIVLRIRPGSDPFHALARRLLFEHSSDRSPGGSRGGTGVSPQLREDSPRILGAPDGGRAPEGPQRSEDIEIAAARLLESPHKLSLLVRGIADRESAKVLLLIDQLEELYTLVDDVQIRAQFMRAICTAADDALDPVRVIFTLRDDFIGKLADGLEAREALSQVTVLGPPGRAALEEIVQRSIEETSFRYEDPSLPIEMIAAVEGAPAALPMLQFACRALWDRRDKTRHLLLRSAYESIGGVAGALATHADSVLDSLSSGGLEAARQILLRLVTVERTRRIVARARLLDGLAPEAAGVLDRLIQSRLLTTHRSRAVSGGQSAELELAHESLIRTWARLSRWIDESKEEIAVLAEITQAAELWERRGSPEDELWQGEALLHARRAIARLTPKASDSAVRFIEAGVAKESRRIRGRRSLIFGTIAILAIGALISYQQKTRAEIERARAESQRAEAQRESAEAAFVRGEVWEAKAKLRASLETEDSIEARALWSRIDGEKRIFKKRLPSASNDLAYSPDGRTLAAACQDGFVHLFDARTYSERLLRASDDDRWFLSVTYSPSGRWLVGSEWNGTIAAHDLASGAFKRLLGHSAMVWHLSFSPDEKTLASASWDSTIRLWSWPDGGEKGVLKGHTDRVYGAAFSPDGRILATSSWDKTIQLWDLSESRAPMVLSGHSDKVIDTSFSPDGKTLASGCEDGTIGLWDVATGALKTLMRGHSGRAARVTFHPNGELLATASWDRTVRLWSLATQRQIAILGEHEALANRVEFSPDGTRLASVGMDGLLQVWRIDPGVAPFDDGPAEIGVASLPTSIAISPDGRHIASVGSASEVLVWSSQSGVVETALNGPFKSTVPLAFSADGRLLAAAGGDKAIYVWDREIGRTLKVFSGHEQRVAELAFTRDGTRLISASLDHTVRIWDLTSGSQVNLLRHDDRVVTFALSPDGTELASVTADVRIHLWDLRTGGAHKRIFGEPGIAERIYIAFVDAGRRVAVLSDASPELAAWDLKTGARTTIARDLNKPSCLAALPGGELAYGANSSIRFLDLASGKERQLIGRFPRINACSSSADGAVLTSVALDEPPRTWNTRTGRPMWRAPALISGASTSSRAPELFTHEGWRVLDNPGRPPRPQGASEAWRRAIEEDAVVADFAGTGRSMCLTTLDAHLELWDLHADRRTFRESLAPIDRTLAVEDGCVVLLGQKVRFYDSSGAFRELASDASALGRSGAQVLVAADQRVMTFDASGRPIATRDGPKGATAIAEIGSTTVFGFRNGRIELWGGFANSRAASAPRVIESPHPSPVDRLIQGPVGIVIAGYGSGTVAGFRLENGAKLLELHLPGSIAHLFADGRRLYAVSEIGRYRVHDLRPYFEDYCELMREVWDRSPSVWEEGHPMPALVPQGHRCRTRKAP